MNKKSVLGLLLFSCIVIAGMFLGTMVMIQRGSKADNNQSQQEIGSDHIYEGNEVAESSYKKDKDNSQNQSIGIVNEEEWFSADNASENMDVADEDSASNLKNTMEQPAEEATEQTTEQATEDLTDRSTEEPIQDYPTNQDNSSADEDDANSLKVGSEDLVTDSFNANPKEQATQANHNESQTADVLGDNVVKLPNMQLIPNCNEVDYMKHVPDMIYDSKIEVALDITNPNLDIDARSAILFDVQTRKVLYYKDPIVPVFPASTAKLLTALVALDLCMEEEEVTVGDELDLVASDSTLARIRKGQVLSVGNLIEGMLVPSGNDAAYVIAAYVGRKSLNNDNASLSEALPEFIRLMNNKATNLGTINSCFKTPDGYDAIGQYTTAYDMGMIGLAAADNETIREVCNKSSARNVFVDGNDVTWYTTNSLIKKNSGKYYPNCIGLKTGTSEMAGRCLISLGKKDGKEVVSVIMDSGSAGRWEDSITLLNYGLGL